MEYCEVALVCCIPRFPILSIHVSICLGPPDVLEQISKTNYIIFYVRERTELHY